MRTGAQSWRGTVACRFTHGGGNVGCGGEGRGGERGLNPSLPSAEWRQPFNRVSSPSSSSLVPSGRASRGATPARRLVRPAASSRRCLCSRCVFVCACVLCCLFFPLLLLLLLLLFLLPPRPWMLGRHFPALQPLRFWCFFLLSSTRECTSADLRNSSSRVSLLGEILKETALKSSSWIPTGRRGGVAGVGMA